MTMSRIHCCLCLQTAKKLDFNRQTVPDAIVTIQGYSVCDKHAEIFDTPFSDFGALIRRVKAANNPTEEAT